MYKYKIIPKSANNRDKFALLPSGVSTESRATIMVKIDAQNRKCGRLVVSLLDFWLVWITDAEEVEFDAIGFTDVESFASLDDVKLQYSYPLV